MTLTKRFECALIYATRLHAQQVRKVTGVPYISHLLSVAALVLEDGGTEDEAIAALLHDALEDQNHPTLRQDIKQLFGDEVLTIVEGCTESDTIPKPPWRDRKLWYLEHLRGASVSVRRIALADKLHNARSLLADWRRLGDGIWHEFKQGKAGTLWFYDCLLEIFPESSAAVMRRELEEIVEQLR
jgi:(p)ppGpp synthase/HD superfamily hydrolase